MPEQVERRRHRRLPLKLPLVLIGGRESGHFIEETASENVSAGGVYFKTEVWALMPVGTRLYLVIEIPSADGHVLHSSRLQTVGRVVRVSKPAENGSPEEGGGVRGVAVAFEKVLRFAS